MESLMLAHSQPESADDAKCISICSNSVNAHNQSSRKRVSQACRRCRARKDRCDGQKPACSGCISRGQTCSYDPAIRKRGLPEGYVRDLETYNQGLESYIRDLEVKVAIVMEIHPDAEELEDEPSLELFRRKWQGSRAFQALKNRHPVIQTLNDKFEKRKEDFGGHMGGIDNTDDRSSSLDRTTSLIGHESSEMQKQQKSVIKSMQNSDHRHQSRLGSGLNNRSNPLILPLRSWHLLEAYFTHTHSWLPIVDKNDILRTFHKCSQKHSENPTALSELGSQATLWSILAYADIQHTKAEKMPINAEDDPYLTTSDLYSYARILIPAEDGDHNLHHLQALLVISLLNMGLGKHRAAWLLVGQASRVAVQLGLNRHRTHPTQPKHPNVTSQEARVFLGCFVLDTLISARLDRCPQLGVEDIDSIGGIVEENGLEEWEPWVDCLGKSQKASSTPIGPPLIFSTFNKFIRVLRTLNKNLHGGSQDSSRREPDMVLIKSLTFDGDRVQKEPQRLLASSQDSTLSPHHINYHLDSLTTILRLHNRHYIPSVNANEKQQDSTDILAAIEQAFKIMARHRTAYGLRIAPPIFEYFLSIVYESCHLVDGYKSFSTTEKETMDVGWKVEMLSYVKEMQEVWPTWARLRQTLDQECIMDATIAELVSTSGPNLIQDIYASGSYFNDRTPLAETNTNIQGNVPGERVDPEDSVSKNGIFGAQLEPSKSMSLSRQEKPIHNDPLPDASAQPSLDEPSKTQPRISPLTPKIEQNAFLLPPLFNSDFDQDAIFNAFTTIDAMEWTETYDQSLSNLGFTSSENTLQDFYEFYENISSP